MTYGRGQTFKVTSTGIAGLKVAICSKTLVGENVASLLGLLQLATISARLRQAKFF